MKGKNKKINNEISILNFNNFSPLRISKGHKWRDGSSKTWIKAVKEDLLDLDGLWEDNVA